MSYNDSEYFSERAAVERAQAMAAIDPRAAAAHQELARGYDALVRKEQFHGGLRLVATNCDQHTAAA